MTCRWSSEAADYLADGEACRVDGARRPRNRPWGDAQGRAGVRVHRRPEKPLDRLNRNSEVRGASQ